MNEDADYRSVASVLFWFLGIYLFIVLGIYFFVGSWIGDKHKTEANYTYRDSITFMDKDTDERVIQLNNVEFRVLGKGSFMYQVQDGEKEVLVCDEIPPNTYPMIEKR